MKKCPKCGFFPLEEVEVCPLCNTVMESVEEEDTSPLGIKIEKNKTGVPEKIIEDKGSSLKDAFTEESSTIYLTEELKKEEIPAEETKTPASRRISTGAQTIERAKKLRNYASFVERTLAFLFDLAFILLICGFCVLTGFYISGTLPKIQQMDVVKIRSILEVSLGVFFFLLAFFYFTVFHGLCGQTPGKMIFEIMVIDNLGEPPGIERAAFRFLGYIISIFTLFVGFLNMLFDKKRQCLHDKISNTEVIRV